MKVGQGAQLREAQDEIASRFALGHGQGLVFAYAIEPGRPPRELGTSEAEEALASKRGLVWLHLDLTTTPAKRWIETRDWLCANSRELLSTREDRAQFRVLDHGIAGLLRDFHKELDQRDWRVGELHFYADQHRLITGRRHPLAALDRTRQAVLQGAEAQSGVTLLWRIIESLGDLLDEAADHLIREIEHVEDHMEGDEATHLRAGLGEMRKRAILFHRQIHGERRVMSRLAAKPPAFFLESDTQGLREALDHLAATGEELDTIEVRAKLLLDELAARLAETTNRNLFFLSILSAIMLPMSLLAGIFGMNFAGIPGAESPLGFAIGTGVILAVGAITVVVLRISKIW